ncbi:MAG TPA: T9SS type A sorting domain-containing protein [Chitinophagaceae bacterium]|nr:T9SS type A sorting domain-containing protein [Chitinophagaceae bacterium]
MKKRLLLYAFIPYMLLTNAHAQLYKIELAEKAQASTLVAEGKVIAQKCFWNEAHNMIYTANTVEVYKTFKGNAVSSTIEVLTQGGSVGTRAVEVSDLLTLHKGQTGIFFCYENTASIKSPTRQTLYDVYSSDQGFLRYNYASNTASAPFASYKDIENNLYSIIENVTGQTKKVVNTSFNVGKMLRMPASASSNGVSGTLAPTITSFSPATVNAGALNDPANSTLTINGSGFGNSPGGSAAINFTDGNTDNTPPDYPVPYNSPYVVSWNNTTIVVKVPTRAATGNFSVVLNDGTTMATSPTQLTVNFSVLNFVFDFSSLGIDTVVASEPRLMNANSKGGYTYRFSSDTAGSGIDFSASPAVATFNRAVTTWKEIVGANLTVGSTTTTQTVADDEINVVEYDNKNTGVPAMAAGVLEVTYSWGSVCYSNTPSFVMYTAQKSGFDILLRNPAVSKGSAITFEAGPCFPAIGSYDLENIILHELGHALNLAHINDGYEASPSAYAHVNPSKIMHYAIIDYADRRSPDNSAYTGTLYTVAPQDDVFGTCGLYPGEMVPLDYTAISNDECPATFPSSATPTGTKISFDLVHATSNKHKDPAFTQVNCLNNGAFVTNNAYYAIKTSATSNGTLSINVSNYTTTPAELAACSGQGIRLALYQVSACPVGQSYPPPVTCATFTGNGPIADITGLAANTTYLLYFDGLRNTKANFTITLTGNALPIALSSFTGEYIHGVDNLYIEIQQAINVKNIAIEKSADGNAFAQLGILPVPSSQLIGKHTYVDAQPYAGKNYYRLKVIDNDGNYQYSNIVVLQNRLNQSTYIYPNPAKNNAYISISGVQEGRYAYVVYDAAGKAVISNSYNLTASAQTISVPLNNIASGVYMVRIVDHNGKTISEQKLVKQ